MERKLPNGWSIGCVPDLISEDGVFSDGDWVESKDQDPNGDVRLIQLADIGITNFRDKSDRYLTSNKAKELRCTFLKKDDILVARMPDPLGRACLFPLEGKYVTVVDVAIIRPNCDPNWLMYMINSPEIAKEIFNNASGSTRLRISRKNLSKIELPIPPLTEQQRIVAKLDSLFGHLDSLNARLDRVPELLKNFRQQVLKKAFSGKLTDQNAAWPSKKLSDLSTKVGSGATPKGGQASYKPEGIPLVRSMNVHFGGIKYDGLAFIDDDQADALSNVEIEENDVLLNITGASIGRVCIAEDDIVGGRVNQHVSIIRAIDTLIPSFLNFYLTSPIMQDFINKENYGVTRPALTKGQILNFEIPVPSVAKQQEIVKEVESLFELADQVEALYDSLKEKIDTLPQSILNKAFKGELIPQDPNDEPASVLLERIKVEREAEKKSVKKTVRKNPIRKSSEKLYELKKPKNMKILEVLSESNKPMTPKEVWQASEYKDDIEAFYAALKVEVEKETVVESSDKQYLELSP